MDFKAKGIKVTIDPNEQSNQAVLDTIQEFADVAKERGLELPFATGVTAVEATVENPNARQETYESISEQRVGSIMGYKSTVDAINLIRNKRPKIKTAEIHMFDTEFEEWLTEDKLDYVKAEMKADPELRFTLVATPNIPVAAQELSQVAKEFGKNQPYSTDVYSPMYDCYTPLQLSGADPGSDKAFMFSLIPNKFTADMYGTAIEQRAKLAKLQVENPFLRVPSVFEDLTFWNTLRAQGDALNSGNVFDRTYIRHFDLTEQKLDGRWFVPGSFVNGSGRPDLYYSGAQDGSSARVLVG